jgi:MFS family permease
MTLSKALSARQLTFLVCSAQFLAYLDSGFWPALLPELSRTWSLSNREAGWITAMHYAAYLMSAPLILGLTDRVSSKTIYVFGLIATAAGAWCFAIVADDLWGAIASRALSGLGEAGRFMVAVKLLSEHLGPRELSRGIAWNALTIGVASAISFLCIEPIAQVAGWRAAFIVTACGTVLGCLIVWQFVPSVDHDQRTNRERGGIFNLLSVFRNRAAMTYVIAYSVHTFESVAFRGWVVAFLAYSAANSTHSTTMPTPTVTAMIMVFLGTGASFLGNEIAMRLGRDRLVTFAFIGSSVFAMLVGFIGTTHYNFAVVLVLVYGVCVYSDSAALTAGTSSCADPRRRGATLAVHSTIGYVGGVFGPLVVGAVLDMCGGMSSKAWGLTFLLIGVTDLLGLICFWLIRPRDMQG